MPDPGFGGVLTPLNTQMTINYGSNNPGAGIQQNNGADWFGPLNPLRPIAPEQVRGRSWDYPVGYNVQTRPRAYEPVSFGQLQALADTYDLLRIILETRKDQLSRLAWHIVPKVEVNSEGKKSPVSAGAQKRADELSAFFRRPFHKMRWAEWVRRLLEDLLVIDAPTLFAGRSRGGQVLYLKPINGATINRVIDDWGDTPQYPAPAYQQILKGLPALDYTVRDLLWRPRNMRNGHAYGMSPVEQIIMTVNVGLRRQVFTLNYFTEGTMPDALIGVPGTWSADQVQSFQQYFDEMLQGDLAARRRVKFVPDGVGKNFVQTKDPELKGPFDEWLARVTCFAFSISPEPFITRVNRATAETSLEQAKQEGLAPLQLWLKDWIDDILEDPDFFNEPDFEFQFKDDKELDPATQQKIISGYVGDGIYTINDGLKAIGEQPSDDPVANQRMVKTANGYVPLDANTIEGKKKAMDILGPPELPGQGGFGKPDDEEDGGKPASPIGKSAAASGEKKSEAKEEVGKSSLPFVAKRSIKFKRLPPLKYDRPLVRKAKRQLQILYAGALAKAAKTAASSVKAALSKVEKDDADNEKKAKRIADAADLGPLEDIEDDAAEIIGDVAADSSRLALAQLGADSRDALVDQVNADARDWAREQAAELISGIDETTRDDLRRIIADGLDDNIGLDEIADAIEAATGFDEDRADLIARTEISNANSTAAVEGYKAARDEGVNVMKEWLVDDEPCAICEANAAQGPIDLDEDFESGDDSPPAHPNCECAVSPVVEDEGTDTTDEE